jgi:hypothetical protein
MWRSRVRDAAVHDIAEAPEPQGEGRGPPLVGGRRCAPPAPVCPYGRVWPAVPQIRYAAL